VKAESKLVYLGIDHELIDGMYTTAHTPFKQKAGNSAGNF